MERYKNLDGFQKFIARSLVVMFAVFTVVYAVTISMSGYAYEETILVHHTENGNAIYAGEINGERARFTVSSDKIVTFTYGDKTYGPYVVKEDPTAIPKDTMCKYGVEIREGDKIFFRGGYFYSHGHRFLYSEDGSTFDIGITVSSSNGGIVTDANGNIVDPMKPTPYTILSLAEGPELTHKGSWIVWFGCLLLSAMVMISVLFADELFHWGMSFRVQDAEMVEPSDWEITRRYIGWGLVTFLILILYFTGLK